MQLHRFPFPHDRWQEEVSVGIITKSYASLSSIIQIKMSMEPFFIHGDGGKYRWIKLFYF